MKNKIGRIIEAVILIAGILATVAVVIAIPLKSYYEYGDYLAWIEEINKPEPKPILESISAELKEGVKYFKNDLAEPKASDFLVKANYTLDGVPYSEEIEAGKFSIATKNNFYSQGGEVIVTYKNQTTVVNIELIPLKLESISIVQNPYRVRYQTGSTFDAEGMILHAVYNDGSTKLIPADKYVVDSKVLAPTDTSIAISYTEGDETKNAVISITVSDVLDDGAVVSLVLRGDAIVQSGDKLSNTDMVVSAVYESGNRKQLSPEEYTILDGDTVAKFGKAYNIVVSYNQTPTITLSTPVVVRSTLEGEKGTIVGGKTNTETEYVVVDGVIQQTDTPVSFAGNFTAPIKNGKEGSLEISINSEAAVTGNITVRSSNSYCCYANGADASAGYIMQPLQINTILDLTVNGKEVAIPDSVVLKGSGPHKDFAPLFGIYYEFTFEDIALEAGTNVVKFTFKFSTTNAVNVWNESPSTLNIDCVKFDTVGSEIPDNYTIEKIEIAPNFTIKHNQITTGMKPAVVATLTNGTKILTPAELLDVKITGGKAGESRVVYGKYTVTATLKSNPEITTSKDYEVKGVRVLKAGLEVIDGRVYYVFSGNSYGYVAEDFRFFDKEDYDLIIEFNETDFTFKIDVTDLEPGTVIYPHLAIQGVMYNNGSNNNGDILGQGLTFKDGLTVTHNGKIYKIERMYSMPNLHIYAEETN